MKTNSSSKLLDRDRAFTKGLRIFEELRKAVSELGFLSTLKVSNKCGQNGWFQFRLCGVSYKWQFFVEQKEHSFGNVIQAFKIDELDARKLIKLKRIEFNDQGSVTQPYEEVSVNGPLALDAFNVIAYLVGD